MMYITMVAKPLSFQASLLHNFGWHMCGFACLRWCLVALGYISVVGVLSSLEGWGVGVYKYCTLIKIIGESSG